MGRLYLMLGHGRAIEAYLIGAKFLIAAIILLPGPRPKALVFDDLLWLSDYWLSLPFLALAITQLTGLILNMNGVRSSWVWRSVGASAAICLWTWLIIKTVALDVIAAGALPFWIMSALASVFLLWRGLNRLPHPGAPGSPG